MGARVPDELPRTGLATAARGVGREERWIGSAGGASARLTLAPSHSFRRTACDVVSVPLLQGV